MYPSVVTTYKILLNSRIAASAEDPFSHKNHQKLFVILHLPREMLSITSTENEGKEKFLDLVNKYLEKPARRIS